MHYDEKDYICGLSLSDDLEIALEATFCDRSHSPYVINSESVTPGHSECICLLAGHSLLFVTSCVLSSSSLLLFSLLCLPCFSPLPYLFIFSVLSFLPW